MNITGVYKTQHGELTIVQNGDDITASYQENGVCSGKLNGNKVEGAWKNKKDQGLFEWTFDGDGKFSGKYKSGLESGPMRGKWDGKIISHTSSDPQNVTSNPDQIEITISGRIAKYYFGRIKDDLQDELKSVLSISDEAIETEQDFLKLFLSITLEAREEARDNFKNLVPLDAFEEQCPNLFAIFNEVLEYDLDHFGLYDALFDTAEYWEGGTGFVSFFEDDCKVSFVINGQETIKDLSLGEFAQQINGYHTENPPENDQERILSDKLKEFIQLNSEEFGLSEDMGVSINKEGAMFSELWFTPQALEAISDRENSVSIYHDDIIDYTFYIETEKFEFSKLLFLTYANYADFRGNSLTTLANYIFYDNKIIQPDETWHRDKGIELEYESKDISLDFLING